MRTTFATTFTSFRRSKKASVVKGCDGADHLRQGFGGQRVRRYDGEGDGENSG